MHMLLHILLHTFMSCNHPGIPSGNQQRRWGLPVCLPSTHPCPWRSSAQLAPWIRRISSTFLWETRLCYCFCSLASAPKVSCWRLPPQSQSYFVVFRFCFTLGALNTSFYSCLYPNPRKYCNFLRALFASSLVPCSTGSLYYTTYHTFFQSMWARVALASHLQGGSFVVNSLQTRTGRGLFSKTIVLPQNISSPSLPFPTRNFSLSPACWKGHNKWSNIKHIKGARDAEISKKNLLFRTRILSAVKTNGNNTNTDSNIALRKVLEEAKSQMVPKATIDKALKDQ